MARLFAQAVTDGSLRQQIHDGAAQRFDGDTNVLYKTLAASSGVRSALATAYSRGLNVQAGDALSQIDTLARTIPRFQVAVPANLDKWDAAGYTPLVGFVPTGVDDTALTTITAYDAAGKAYKLDAKAAPKKPVIILGLNERTDNAGNLRKDVTSMDDASHTLTAQGRYQVRVISVSLHDDKEPWPKGDAEVMLFSKGPNLYYDGGFRESNNTGDYNIYNRVIGTTTGNVVFYWYEDDGANLDITISYKGVSLGFKIDDDDDFMGAIELTNGYFKGGTDNSRNVGSLTQVTD